MQSKSLSVFTQSFSLFSSIVLLLSIPISAFAAPGSTQAVHGGDIEGSLTRCGDPLVRAHVYIPGQSFLVKTAHDGSFKIFYVQPGSYQIAIEEDGDILTVITDVAVVKNKTTELGTHDICLDQDNDGFDESVDCDDQNPAVSPDAVEACDGVDNNCNDEVDENCPVCTDSDSDGFFAQEDCDGDVDCDDNESSINPGANETCFDSIDNDCDGTVDEDCLTCSPGGVCDTTAPGVCATGVYDEVCTCEAVFEPGVEVCDGVDNDCNGLIDEGVVGGSCQDVGQCSGLLVCTNGSFECQVIVGPEDEICDGIDNDCDGDTDEDLFCGCPSGQTDCSGQCVDLTSDPLSCGSCGNVCSSGVCEAGSCTAFTCDPLDPEPECGSNQHCIPQDDGVPDCVGPIGSGVQDSVCNFRSDCAAEYECIILSDTNRTCLQWCNMSANDCPAGYSCLSASPNVFVGGQEYGLCRS